MSLIHRLVARATRADDPEELRSSLLEVFTSWSNDSKESLPHDFATYVQQGYKANGIVFALITARMLLFSEADLAFRDRKTKQLDTLHPELDLFVNPWPNATAGEMLARMEQDASMAGNAYVRRLPGLDRLERLRPDLVDIIIGERVRRGYEQEGIKYREVIGYAYHHDGRGKSKPQILLPEDVAHWCPIPDPEANFRGMSWLTAIAREVDADTLMTKHKARFFKNAATPNMVIKVAGKLPEDVRPRIEAAIKARHEGWENAYKTMLIEGGADVQVVGADFSQMAFATVQAAGENRVAAAAGVPGIVCGLKEGLQAATYSNYQQAMRRFVDLTMRPLWRSACASLAPLVNVPAGSELWYDDRDISALKQDEKDRAEIAKLKAETAGLLIRAGYVPEDVGRVAATGEGLDSLEHTGNVPVTLYPDGKEEHLKPGGGKQAPEDQGSTK